MVRMQIQLTEDQARAVRRLARERGVSIAAVIRDAVERSLAERPGARHDAWERALSVVGKFRGPGGSVAEDHDEWFAEAAGHPRR
jgi:hypothetical protein